MKRNANTTQLKMLTDHLKKFGSIDTYTAFGKYGITRLSSYIYIMRNKGVYIRSARNSSVINDGTREYIARYCIYYIPLGYNVESELSKLEVK